jgi:hypothetical protein
VRNPFISLRKCECMFVCLLVFDYTVYCDQMDDVTGCRTERREELMGGGNGGAECLRKLTNFVDVNCW